MKRKINIGFIGFSQNESNQILEYIHSAEQEQAIQSFIFADDEEVSKKYCPYYDIIFLDAQSLASTWEHIIQTIHSIDDSVYMVLVSSSLITANQGYKYKVRGHLLKPVKLQDIVHVFDSYKKDACLAAQPYIWLDKNKTLIKLYLHKLRYIEAHNHLMLLHYDGKIIEYRRKQTLANFMEILPDNQFFRCNHSYIVNLKYIEEVFPENNRYEIRLQTGEKIPLSRNLKKPLSQALNK